jgi:hypothetical protein
VAVVSQQIAAGMPKHVRMDRKRQLGPLSDACEKGVECLGRHGAITFREEHECPPLQAPQSPYFVTLQWACAGAALLAPAHTQGASIEIDLRPLQVAEFGRP